MILVVMDGNLIHLREMWQWAVYYTSSQSCLITYSYSFGTWILNCSQTILCTIFLLKNNKTFYRIILLLFFLQKLYVVVSLGRTDSNFRKASLLKITLYFWLLICTETESEDDSFIQPGRVSKKQVKKRGNFFQVFSVKLCVTVKANALIKNSLT